MLALYSLKINIGECKMTIEAQVEMLIRFHGKQGAFDYAKFHALNDRKQHQRSYWLEVLEFIKNM